MGSTKVGNLLLIKYDMPEANRTITAFMSTALALKVVSWSVFIVRKYISNEEKRYFIFCAL
jgi:hypothetical protein